MSVCMAMLGKCVVTGLLLVLSLCRWSASCPQPSLPTSEQLMICAWSVLLLDWWSPPAIESNLPDQLALAGNTLGLAVGSRGPPPPCPLTVFSSSFAQWCRMNTTHSRGSARHLRRFTRVWHLEPARERFRRWMKTRVALPPYQVECSCQTTKALSLSRAPYTPSSFTIAGETKIMAHTLSQNSAV